MGTLSASIQAADAAFLSYDFGDAQVIYHSSWSCTTDGAALIKDLLIELPEDGSDEPAHAATFLVSLDAAGRPTGCEGLLDGVSIGTPGTGFEYVPPQRVPFGRFAQSATIIELVDSPRAGRAIWAGRDLGFVDMLGEPGLQQAHSAAVNNALYAIEEGNAELMQLLPPPTRAVLAQYPGLAERFPTAAARIKASDEPAEALFEEVYAVRRGVDGFYATREEVEAADKRRVWTVIDGEDGRLFATAGHHLVNRIGWVLTQHPWCSDEEEYPLDAQDELESAQLTECSTDSAL